METVSESGRLIFCGDQTEFCVEDETVHHYVYCFGFARVAGKNFSLINNQERLYEISDNIRAAYADWVLQHNQEFIRAGLVESDFSLFFLSDFSTKRGEVFETFDIVCGLLLVKEILSAKRLDLVELHGVDSSLVAGIQSIFPNCPVSVTEQGKVASYLRRALSDVRYLAKYCLIGSIFSLYRKKQCHTHVAGKISIYHSFFPSMIGPNGVEEKYGGLADNGLIIATILADGMHQNFPFAECFRYWRKFDLDHGLLVDEYFSPLDVVRSIPQILKTYLFLPGYRKWSPPFRGVNLKGLIEREVMLSVSRIVRLSVVRSGYRRFLERNPWIDRLYCYPAEYPYGRMLTVEAANADPRVNSTGVQMGPVSPRRLEQVLAVGEASHGKASTDTLPIPDEMLVEDKYSQYVYRAAGYQNINVMREVYRTRYLRSTELNESRSLVLLAAGLHDSPSILFSPQLKVGNDNPLGLSIKIHPRSGQLLMFRAICREKQIPILDEPIGCLLSRAKKVFATYSSVALEARQLGLDVEIIEIPGKINTLCFGDRT